MKKYIFATIAVCCISNNAHADVSLQQCIEGAEANYPLIKKYELLSSSENIALSDINKSWLPHIGLYAQGTVQNVVPSFPSALSNMMHQMGTQMKGLGKLQYKIGADINQTIWDGGASKSKREITRNQTAVNRAALDVEMYGIRERVQSIYFGILLIESQIQQSESALNVYDANLIRLRSMLTNGVAMQSDVDMVEAQSLVLKQQIITAKSAVKSYRQMLSIFTDMNIEDEKLIVPSSDIPFNLTSHRPELSLMDSRRALNDAQRGMVDASLKPKIGMFAQSYYGYPGIDYFKAMMGRDLSFNILAGIKVSWDIDPFYTKKNYIRKIEIANQEIDSERETFLFNSKMQSASQLENIQGIESEMKDDARIVELRTNVRNAAESQLRNGIIDATALTTKINDETQAKLTAAYHKIQRLQAIYNLKNTLNR